VRCTSKKVDINGAEPCAIAVRIPGASSSHRVEDGKCGDCGSSSGQSAPPYVGGGLLMGECFSFCEDIRDTEGSGEGEVTGIAASLGKRLRLHVNRCG
jgi:hypothetical protein